MKNKNNLDFISSAILNNETFLNYQYRFKKIATSLFEWVNLPSSMDARYLEETLYYFGSAVLLYDDTYGFINTKGAFSGDINIYGLPTEINCNSFGFQSVRPLYMGFKDEDKKNNNKCILVMNNFDRVPTAPTIDLFCYRLYEVERTMDTNVKAQKTPVMILCSDRDKLTMKNLYSQYDGNQPFIMGDKDIINGKTISSINTSAPYVIDKLTEYKKEIWNEALTFLGITNLDVNKKERLVSDEASRNNELINLNLQSALITRQKACDEFNEYFNMPEDKKISVRVRSDLHNVIKEVNSVVKDLKEDIKNGEIYNRTQ